MRHRLFPALALLAALASCSPVPPEAVLAKAGTAMFQRRWIDAYKLCDAAFQSADKAGDSVAAIAAAECAAQAAAQAGRPADALPHYAKLFANHAGKLPPDARMRLAADQGVTLIEAGKREPGIAQLREALDTWWEPGSASAKWNANTARALLVKNLARAYYDRASEPAVRRWVQEQADWYVDYMGRNQQSAGNGIGSAGALEALSAIGRRQANTATPEWDAVLREWEAKEQGAIAHSNNKGQVCDAIQYGEYPIYLCMRELKAPP